MPVSGLPAAVDLTEADYFPVVQKITAGGEETRRATMKQIKALIPMGPKGEKGDAGADGVGISDITIEAVAFITPDP